MEIVPCFQGIHQPYHGQFPLRARLAAEEFGSKAHTYSPAYTDTDFPVIMQCSSHITLTYL